MPTSYEGSVPVEMMAQVSEEAEARQESKDLGDRVKSYVCAWKSQLKNSRTDRMNVWNECWQLYNCREDWSDKEDWQSKIALPKAFASVKQATNVIKRLLTVAKQPWILDAENPDDLVTVLRASQMTDLTKVFLDKAHYIEEFAEGLECGFIMGLGLWKLWWGLVPRTTTQVKQGYAPDGTPQRQLTREEILEGRLFMRAVDPYNFYWLPGSKMNRWVGTIEEIEVPKWELMEMAELGAFDPKIVEAIQPKKTSEHQKQAWLRFGERPTANPGPSAEVQSVTLTEFYGPIVIEGKIVERHGHTIVANDNTLLIPSRRSPFWHRKPPYIGFSPLALPFRTEGVGLIEMVRAVDKALNRIANLSVDTLVFRLLPVFEFTPEVFENPEDFETGLSPGKLFRRSLVNASIPGIRPIEFQDISAGTVQVAAQLDRAHQEGAMVSEIQQSLPRYRGQQTAEEISTKTSNEQDFLGSMAADIEQQALKPIIEMAVDLIFQFIDTANDPRIASILGVGAQQLMGMSKEELLEMIQGEYKIKVSGITSQLQKAEMLQNLVQFMNLIGQNAEAWMPYLNQNVLLQRILEAFRPAIHDIEQIIADPETAQAREAAMQNQQQSTEAMRMIPQLVQMAQAGRQQETDNQLAANEQTLTANQQLQDLAIAQAQARGAGGPAPNVQQTAREAPLPVASMRYPSEIGAP